MNIRKLRNSIVLILCVLLFTGCSSKSITEERTQTNEFEDSEIEVYEIQDKGMLNSSDDNDSFRAASETATEFDEDKKDTFPAKWYVTTNDYGIAPGELANKDMERPEFNNEWLRSLVIKYPQLYNLEDQDKEMQINDMLYKEAAYYHDVLGTLDYIEYSLDYEIMEANEDIISILFLGEARDYHVSSRFAHAITVDIKSEKQLKLENFFVIDKTFVKEHLYKDFEVVENNFEDITENTPYVKAFVESYGQNSHTKDYYIKGDDIGIIIPTLNSMGYIMIQGNTEKSEKRN